MPEPVLSAEEIEMLLAPSASQNVRQEAPPAPTTRLPLRPSTPEWVALQAMLSHAGNSFVREMAAIVRSPLELEGQGLEETSARPANAPDRWTCRATVTGEGPKSESVLLAFDSALLGWMMGRMLGGREAIQLEPGRALTPIEERMVLRMAGVYFEALTAACVCLRGLKLDSVAAESAFAGDLRTGVRSRSAVRGATVLGHVELQLSWDGARKLAQGLLAKQPPESAPRENMAPSVEPSGMLVTASLPTIELPAEARLEVGDVIDTELPASEPLVIAVEGVPRFQGSPSQWEGRLVVEIERSCQKPPND